MTTPHPPVVTVVLADDHPVWRALVRRMIELRPELRLLGEAKDGREALELVIAHDPDVVVVDRYMPHLSGDEIILRLAERGRRTRVVLLTGDTDAVAELPADPRVTVVHKDTDREQICELVIAAGRWRP